MLKDCRLALVFLLCIVVLCGCGVPKQTATAPTETQPVEQEQETTEPTEETVKQITLSLDMEEVTLTTIGEKVTIYSDEVPAEQIFWFSDDSSVVSVEAGVLTAMGDGVSNVYGIYGDQTMLCSVTSTAAYTWDRNPILEAPGYENVDASFFDDAVFVGDSISLKMSYVTDGRLGNAQFLAQSSYSVHNSVNDKMVTTYRGKQYRNLEDAIAATGAKKVFIMLGVNDIGLFDLEDTIENWRIMIEQIREVCPDVQIYIQSMTPMWTGSERKKLTNENIRNCNFALRLFAEQQNCGYIDIAPYLQDGTGGLAAKYSSDKYVHITEAGISVWISVLRAYANYQ